MVSLLLSLAALVLVTALFGVHLFGQLALNPALRTMDASTYVPVKHAIDLTAPALARPLMLSCLAATAAALLAAALTGAIVGAAASAVALVTLTVTLVAILRGDLPINRQMTAWSPDAPPADWRTTRARWETFFTVRVAANALALLTSVSAVVASALALD